MPPRTCRRGSSLALAVLALTGCECGGGGPGAGAAGAGTEEPGGAELAMGTVEGVVRLAEGAATPRYEPNPFVGEGPRALPPECTPPTASDAEPMRILGGRAMTNVPVVATGDPARWPRRGTPELHEIHFADCRPTPPVVVVTRGDRVRLVNDTDYPFFPHVGPGGFYEALLRGEPREIEIDLGGPQTMSCAMTAVCGSTEILAFHHPVHTVSGEGGRFRLDVPAEQELTLTAWHPLLADDGTVTTRVAAGETVSVEIVVRPRAAPSGASAPAGEGVAAPSAPTGSGPSAADPPDEAPF